MKIISRGIAALIFLAVLTAPVMAPAAGIMHKFVSPKADGGDATLVRPSNWNDSHEIKDDITIPFGSIKFTFITAPTAPTVALGGAGVLTGNYYYKVTFVTATGETQLGTTSTLIAPSSQQVELTNIPTSSEYGVTARKIYRTKAGTTTYWLLYNMLDNVTTTYTDNIADGSLGATDSTNRANSTSGIIKTDANIWGYLGPDTSIAMGRGAWTNRLGAFITAFGYTALNKSVVSGNTAFGAEAGFNTTTGSNDSYFGQDNFYNNSTGQGNTGSGQGTAYNNNGSFNSVFGAFSMYYAAAVSYNTINGYDADHYGLGGYNTISGALAGYGTFNNSYTYDCLFGYRSGYGLSTGSHDILIGYQSGDNITTAGYSIIIGDDLNADSATADYQLNIGGAIKGQTSGGTSEIRMRLVPRVSTIADSATPTPNGNTDDEYTVTALAQTATFGAPTGTPIEGQTLIIRVKDNGTARSLSWNAIYRAVGAVLPATTVIGETLYVEMIYNSTDAKWDVRQTGSYTPAQVGLGNVTNDAQVKKAASSTNGAIPTWSGTTGDALNTGGLTAPSGTIVGTTDTQTLTNKRITGRVYSEASSATPTPAADSYDQHNITALAAAATFAAPTGTPTDGQKLIIRIKDNGTAQTLSWNAIYRAGTDVALPTTTVLSKTMYLGFIYNSADSKWDLIALTNNI